MGGAAPKPQKAAKSEKKVVEETTTETVEETKENPNAAEIAQLEAELKTLGSGALAKQRAKYINAKIAELKNK